MSRHSWAERAIEEISPTVHRIPLPLPTDGLRAVNVYAIHDAAGITLVDGGWDVPEAEAALRIGFTELGLDVAEISSVVTTHFHRDHYTLAVRLRGLTGCRVGLGLGESESIAALLAGGNSVPGFTAIMRRAGVPPDETDPRQLGGGRSAQEGYAQPDTWLEDGDVISAPAHELEAIATPGHTRGHLCFADERAGLFFAGDHVLPHITPSIGFETRPAHLPLGDYLSSLAKIRARPDARLLPAHGPVGASVHERVDEVLLHHEIRLEHCLAALAKGATTGYEVANELRWTRHERRWRDLSNFDRVLAAHETMAHLDVLVVQGRAVSRSDDGTAVFSATFPAANSC